MVKDSQNPNEGLAGDQSATGGTQGDADSQIPTDPSEQAAYYKAQAEHYQQRHEDTTKKLGEQGNQLGDLRKYADILTDERERMFVPTGGQGAPIQGQPGMPPPGYEQPTGPYAQPPGTGTPPVSLDGLDFYNDPRAAGNAILQIAREERQREIGQHVNAFTVELANERLARAADTFIRAPDNQDLVQIPNHRELLDMYFNRTKSNQPLELRFKEAADQVKQHYQAVQQSIQTQQAAGSGTPPPYVEPGGTTSGQAAPTEGQQSSAPAPSGLNEADQKLYDEYQDHRRAVRQKRMSGGRYG